MTKPDPWDEWQKRRREGLFGDAFPPEFEREFDRLREEMERMMAQAFKGLPFGAPGAAGPVGKPGEPNNPFVYGFSMRMGPDGRPHFEQFGNTNPTTEPTTGGAREPLTDVIENDREIALTVELPGVSKGDINLHVGEEKVTIKVETGRRYYKEIKLPSPVVPKTAQATFKNGILDLTIERVEPRTDPGFKVDIR